MLFFAVLLIPLLLPECDPSDSGAKSQTICYGDVRELRCESDETLKILDSSYRVLEPNSSTCSHVNWTSTLCGQPLLSSAVENACAGRRSCLLNLSERELRNCLSALYLTVLYKCEESPAEENNVDPGLALPEGKGGIIATRSPFASTSQFNTSETIEINISKVAMGRSGVYLVITQLLMSVTLAVEYALANRRQLILCAVLSVSGGCLVFIVILLIASCWSKYKSNKAKKDVEDGANGAVAMSEPLLSALPAKFDTIPVIRENGVPKGEIYSHPRQSSTLPRLGPNRSHEVIYSIRRSHSIDEGTQTDHDADEEIEMQPQTLSEDEARELGYLVDIMKFYNNQLEEDSSPSQAGGGERPPGRRVKISSPDAGFVGRQSKLPSKSPASPQHRPPEITSFAGNKSTVSGRDKPVPSFMAGSPSPFLHKQPNGSAYREPAELAIGRSIPNAKSDRYNGYATPRGERYTAESSSGQQSVTSGNSSVPSELSYQTSNESATSIDYFSPDSIFNGDTLRFSSMQRQNRPRRGDGYSYIGGVFGV